MNAVELFQRLHQHRAWVNSNLLTAAATLSDEQSDAKLLDARGNLDNALGRRTSSSSF